MCPHTPLSFVMPHLSQVLSSHRKRAERRRRGRGRWQRGLVLHDEAVRLVVVIDHQGPAFDGRSGRWRLPGVLLLGPVQPEVGDELGAGVGRQVALQVRRKFSVVSRRRVVDLFDRLWELKNQPSHHSPSRHAKDLWSLSCNAKALSYGTKFTDIKNCYKK